MLCCSTIRSEIQPSSSDCQNQLTHRMKPRVGSDTKTKVQDDHQRLEEIDDCTKDRISHKDEKVANCDEKGDGEEEDQDDGCTGKNKNGMSPLLLTYNEAPSYLKFNPYIRSGYRGFLTTKMCLESIFWWTNETVNIWSHIFGWMLFMGLTLYDLVLLNIHASFTDKFIVALLLVCFQICMILSSMYHTFSCRSERAFVCFLSFDLFGIALSLLAIYMSGVYYAFWCHKEWQMFYLVTVCLIFVFAMILQIPKFQIDANTKLIVFLLWAAYGVVPTFHWTVIMGGLENPVVQLLLPRVLGMYAISGLAFLIYISKFPERVWAGDDKNHNKESYREERKMQRGIGKVDYIGSSHQWWHLFVVLALYYWHNTGIKYVEFRMNHGCANDMRL